MPDGYWINTASGGGNWGTTSNWQNGQVATGAGFTAYITNSISVSSQGINLFGTTRDLGSLQFSDGGALGAARWLTGSGYLTMNNLGSKPIINCITPAYTNTACLRGTNGFRVTGTGSTGFQVLVSTAISGEIELEKGYLVLGTWNSATPAVLPNVSGFNWVGNTYARLYYYGTTTAFTETRPFTYTGSGGSIANGASVCAQINNALVILSHPSVQTFPGQYTPAASDTLTMCGFSFGTNFPEAAWEFLPQSAHTTNVTRTARFDFAHTTPKTTAARVLFYSLNAVSGLVGVFNDNATAATNFTGVARAANEYGTNSGASFTLSLSGTNTASTYSGDILHVDGSGTLSVQKDGTGTWAVSGNNTYTGSSSLIAGKLSAQSNTALGAATGGVSVSGTAILELVGGLTLNKSSAAFTLHANDPIRSVGDNTVQTGGITLGGTTTFDVTTGTRLAIVNSGAITDGASTFGITKTGAGELALGAFANTYDGTVTVSAGTLAVGSQGSLGTGAGAVQVTATLKYTGAATTFTRELSLLGTSPSLEATDNSGAWTVSSLTHDATSKTITLKGTSAHTNAVSASITSDTGILKTGTGRWHLTGALSYSGTTNVSQGLLEVDATDGNSVTNAVSVASGATLQLRTDADPAVAGAGRVLGTSNVVVNGTLRTSAVGAQRGRMRYGGDLTFNSGAVVYPGAAA